MCLHHGAMKVPRWGLQGQRATAACWGTARGGQERRLRAASCPWALTQVSVLRGHACNTLSPCSMPPSAACCSSPSEIRLVTRHRFSGILLPAHLSCPGCQDANFPSLCSFKHFPSAKHLPPSKRVLNTPSDTWRSLPGYDFLLSRCD